MKTNNGLIMALLLLAGCATQKVSPPVAVVMPPIPPGFSAQASTAVKPFFAVLPPPVITNTFPVRYTAPINASGYNLTFYESDNDGPWRAVKQVPYPNGAWACYNYSGTNASAYFTAKCNQPPLNQ